MAVDWSRVHARRSFSVWTLPLAACSLLYGLGVRLDRARHRLRGPSRLPGLVVSVGALTAGGAGKTPAVAALAGWARDRGYRAAVLSRGYARRAGRGVVTVSDGDRVLARADDAGDEPCMLAHMLPGVPVVVSADRSLAGREAHERWGTNVFVLDDGFQHWALERDLDVVLLDAADPVGNGRLLPWGPLREPVKALGRAHVAMITRSVPSKEGAGAAERLLSGVAGLPRVRSVHVPEEVHHPARSRIEPPAGLEGRRLVAFCGIARPQAFQETLEKLGAEVAAFRRFRDHHPYSPSDVRRLTGLFRETGAHALLTTEKDWMRAGPLLAGIHEAGFLRIRMAFPEGADALFDRIRAKAEEMGV